MFVFLFILGTLCSYDPLWRGLFAWRQKTTSVASLPRPCLIINTSSFLCFVSRSRFCRLIGCNTRDGSTYCCTVYLVVTKGLLFSMYCLFSVLQGLLTRAKTSRRRAKTNRRLAKTNLRRACQDELMIMTRQDESKTCYDESKMC